MGKSTSVTGLVRDAPSIPRKVDAEGMVSGFPRGGPDSAAVLDDYVHGWMAAIDEMRRPDWREVHDQTRRDIAAGRGRDIDVVVQELGLEERSRARRQGPPRRDARTDRRQGR